MIRPLIILGVLSLSAACSPEPAALCSPASCTGCCRGDECVTEPSIEACGVEGAACDRCVAGQVCEGRCVFLEQPQGGGAGGGAGAGGGSGLGGGGGPVLGARDPEPRDGQTNVSLTARVVWSCYGGYASTDLYLGTTNPPPLRQANLPEPPSGFAYVHQPSPAFAANTTYFWRADCKDASGAVTPGPLWTFSTVCVGAGPYPSCAGATSVTDADGNTYGTIEVCGRCWMRTNLRTGTQRQAVEGGMSNDGVVEKYCPANQAGRCTSQGGLYEWSEVMQGATTEGARGLCPAGWHVPTDAEWKALERALGASDADARGSSRGTTQGTLLKVGGTSGFNAPLVGAWSHAGLPQYDFVNDGTATWFWTSTKASTTSNAYYRQVSASSPQVKRELAAPTEAYSVRCVRD